MRDQIHCFSTPEMPGHVFVVSGETARGEAGWQREWTLNVHDMKLSLDALSKKLGGTDWGEGYVRFAGEPMAVREVAIGLTTLRKPVGVYTPDDPRERKLAVLLAIALPLSVSVMSLLDLNTGMMLSLTALVLGAVVAVYSVARARRHQRLF